MQKIFVAVMIPAFAIVIVGGRTSKADAAEVFVGRYSDGTAVYMLTHTIVIRSQNPYSFNCRVLAGRDYLDYSFYPYNGSPFYRNSEGYSGYVNGGNSPVASDIYRYVVNHF